MIGDGRVGLAERVINHQRRLKLSARPNEIETKQFRNSFETVSFHFLF